MNYQKQLMFKSMSTFMSWLMVVTNIVIMPQIVVPQTANAQTPPQATATIQTDLSDYIPGSTVQISGSGFWANEVVTLQVVHLDANGNPLPPETIDHQPWDVNADANGHVAASWYVDPLDSFGQTFRLTAVGYSSGLSASTTFTDGVNVGIDFSQCRNDNGGGSPVAQGVGHDGIQDTCNWVAGSLGSSNSLYQEGDVVPQRVIRAIPTLGSHFITIDHSFFSSSTSAYTFDTFATPDFSLGSSDGTDHKLLTPCNDIPTTGASFGALTYATCLDLFNNKQVFAIPTESTYPTVVNTYTYPFVAGAEADAALDGVTRNLWISCGTVTGSGSNQTVTVSPATQCTNISLSILGHGDSNKTLLAPSLQQGPPTITGDDFTQMQISFTTPAANQLVAIWVGGHLAKASYWNSSAVTGAYKNLGAASAAGASFHVRLIGWDENSAIGNQDNQIQANVVVPPGSITIVKDDLSNSGTSFPFTAAAPLSPTSFSLSGGQQQVFSNLISGQSYGPITELVPSGYSSSMVCTEADGTPVKSSITVTSNSVTINSLQPGDNIKCVDTNSRNTGSLKITKTVSNPDGATLPTNFTGTYDCGTGYTGTWSITSGGGSQTITGIPTGNSCSVAEDPLTPISGYTWGTPTITPSSIIVSSTTGTFEITVANTITRDKGSFKITKTVSNPDGATLPANFTGTYDCGTGYTGTWSITSAGGSKTVTGIPTGNTCSVTEDALTPITGYTWGTPTITPSSIVISSTTGTFEITVANSITRDTGGLKITKTVSNPDGATLPTNFTGTYNCGTGYSGTWSISSAGGSQTINNIPTGSICSVAEDTLTPISGYTWGTPTLTPSSSVTITSKGVTYEITVANSITRDRGSFKITKTVSNPDGATLPATFTGTYNCGTGYTGTWSIGSAGGSQTISNIPTGNSCSVTENTLTPIAGFTWGTPSITPLSIVISTKGGTFEITVANSITRDRGSFKITKTVSNPDGATLPANFTGTYDCGIGYTGTWSITSAGGSQTVNGIPTGSSCSVKEDTLAAIPGFTWGTPTLTPTSIIISTNGGTFEIVVANSITRDLGSFKIIKTVSNPNGATLTANFTGTYDCGTGYTGTWSISSAGGSQTITGIPTGNTCVAYEDALPAITGYVWDTPSFTPASIVISTKGGTFSITVANVIHKLPTLKIIKYATPQTGTFSFSTTGGNGFANFTLAGDPTGNGNQLLWILPPGTYTAHEGTQLGWTLTGIGGGSSINSPTDTQFYCTNNGSDGLTTLGNLVTGTVSVALNYGDNVTCIFENTGNGATRTQGFWATHPQLAYIAWFGGTGYGHTFPGVTSLLGDAKLCPTLLPNGGKDLSAFTTYASDITNPNSGIDRLMGGFWSGISKTTANKSRTSIDQGRMQLLQQLLAAELNYSAFGTLPAGGANSFNTWEAAYCGNNASAISTAQSQAASYNSKGDSSTFTPGTSADSKTARAIGNQAYWDKLP